MAITVRELARLPHLQMTVLAGHRGLDEPVTWVHTSDLPNAWSWHGAGELLLTNATALSTRAVDQDEFLSRLAATGASGLAIGNAGNAPRASKRLRDRADWLGLPLLTVPFSVPFTAVVRAVADANDREDAREVGQVARIYELVRQSIAAGVAGAELLRRLGDELGVQLSLVDPATGRTLVPDEAPRPWAAAVAAGYAANDYALPAMLHLPGADPGLAGAVAVAVPTAHPVVLVVEPVGDRLPSTVLLQHAAAGAALALEQLLARSERQIRAGSDLFTRLVERRIDARAGQRGLATFGVVLGPAMVVAAAPADATTPERLALSFAAHGEPHLLLACDGRVHVLIDDGAVTPPGLFGSLAALPNLGVSEPVASVERIPDAVIEARWALALALSENVPLVRYGAGPVLAGQSPSDAEHLVGVILGPLLRADAEGGSDHVATIRALLEHDRSWQRAADALHIHKQTLRYRLRRIETITGRGFTHTDDLAAWWVALRALRTRTAYDSAAYLTSDDPAASNRAV